MINRITGRLAHLERLAPPPPSAQEECERLLRHLDPAELQRLDQLLDRGEDLDVRSCHFEQAREDEAFADELLASFEAQLTVDALEELEALQDLAEERRARGELPRS